VDSGTTPKPFSATVLGRLTDGIAPGVDMIIASLGSPALTAAGGVWAGMSGSPVYAADGRLIGAVGYSLAPSTLVAGLTPAPDLARLISADPDGRGGTAASRERVRPDERVVAALRRAGVPAAQASEGFTRLPVPVTVSGAATAGGRRLVQRLSRRTGQRVTTGGSSARGVAPATAIVGGGNLAAVAASGDGAVTAVGTTTFTCHGKAVAFGHAFFDTGLSSLSANAATAVFVQPDPVNGPWKVADTGGSAGTVDRDRPTGLRVRVGVRPHGTLITTRLTRVESKVTRTATTTAVYAPLTGDAAGLHVLNNVDVVVGGSQARGTARVMLTITGHRAGGRPFTLRHGDVFTAVSEGGFLDGQVADFVASAVFTLQDQPFEPVTLDTIRVTGTVSSRASTWGSPRIQVKRLGRWVPARTVVATAGSRLWTRAIFTAFQAPTVHSTVKVPLAVPRSAAGQPVELTVTGGSGDDEGFGSQDAPASFDAVLAALRAQVRQDAVTVQLVDQDTNVVHATATRRATHGVDGFAESFRAVVR
jgi:hypothetical protein